MLWFFLFTSCFASLSSLFSFQGTSERYFPLWWAQVRVTLRFSAYVFLSLSPPIAFAILVGSSGFEPPTSRLSGVRSNRLSYEPSFLPSPSGGDERARTDDPLLAKQVLSQLSYTPMRELSLLLRCISTPKIKQRLQAELP